MRKLNRVMKKVVGTLSTLVTAIAAVICTITFFALKVSIVGTPFAAAMEDLATKSGRLVTKSIDYMNNRVPLGDVRDKLTDVSTGLGVVSRSVAQLFVSRGVNLTSVEISTPEPIERRAPIRK